MKFAKIRNFLITYTKVMCLVKLFEECMFQSSIFMFFSVSKLCTSNYLWFTSDAWINDIFWTFTTHTYSFWRQINSLFQSLLHLQLLYDLVLALWSGFRIKSNIWKSSFSFTESWPFLVRHKDWIAFHCNAYVILVTFSYSKMLLQLFFINFRVKLAYIWYILFK